MTQRGFSTEVSFLQKADCFSFVNSAKDQEKSFWKRIYREVVEFSSVGSASLGKGEALGLSSET